MIAIRNRRAVNIGDCEFSVEAEPSDYWEWIDNGHYHNEFDVIKRFAAPDVSFIDAGAWVGAMTLYASRLYKHVYAIEPDPEAMKILVNNVIANTRENISLWDGALTGHIGQTRIGSTILGCSCTRQSCDINAIAVDCVTLREFCKDIPDPLFIKMDVEGAEAQILADWQFFAERKPDIMLSTHPDWWKEAGSDGLAEYAAITKVGKLYRNVFHVDGGRVDFNAAYGDVVFTDKSL